MKKVRVIKHPHCRPYVDHIEPTLETLQTIVGGYVEAVPITTDAYVLCNEEGLINGLDYCATIFNCEFRGTLILIGSYGPEFTDWPLSYFRTRVIMPELWKK